MSEESTDNKTSRDDAAGRGGGGGRGRGRGRGKGRGRGRGQGHGPGRVQRREVGTDQPTPGEAEANQKSNENLTTAQKQYKEKSKGAEDDDLRKDSKELSSEREMEPLAAIKRTRDLPVARRLKREHQARAVLAAAASPILAKVDAKTRNNGQISAVPRDAFALLGVLGRRHGNDDHNTRNLEFYESFRAAGITQNVMTRVQLMLEIGRAHV